MTNRDFGSKVGLIVPLNFAKRTKSKVEYRQAKNIAEAVILQSMEDLYEEAHREESIEFFTGSGFAQCAEIAGMTQKEKAEVLNIIKGAGFEINSAISAGEKVYA